MKKIFNAIKKVMCAIGVISTTQVAIAQHNDNPQWTINLNNSEIPNKATAAAWTTYAGTKALLRMGNYPGLSPEECEIVTPFEEEVYARDAIAEYWSVQDLEPITSDSYLLLLVKLRKAKLIKEYVWKYLKKASWTQPNDLKMERLERWEKEQNIEDHTPLTHGILTATN